MPDIISSFGGVLQNHYVGAKERAKLHKQAQTFPCWELSQSQLCDIERLLNGACSHLDGVLGGNDYDTSVHQMSPERDMIWSISTILDVATALTQRLSLQMQDCLALLAPGGRLFAIKENTDVWQPDVDVKAFEEFVSLDKVHPADYYPKHNTRSCYIGGTLHGMEAPVHYAIAPLRDEFRQ